jgi:hypothetical protein
VVHGLVPRKSLRNIVKLLKTQGLWGTANDQSSA